MKKNFFVTASMLIMFFLSTATVFAADVQELEKRINSLAEELDAVKGKGGGKETERIHFHGYGELHYNRPAGSSNAGSDSQLEMHRMVLGMGAKLTDWIHLDTEIDFEHGAQELELEFANLSFMLDPKLNVRAGKMLMPIGYLNEYHEPPLFWSVERPELQTKLIPSTWGAGGAGFFGTLADGLKYRLYVVNSLQSVRPSGFSEGDGTGGGGKSGRFRASDGIRAGRLEMNKAIAEDFAVAGRLDYSKLYPGLQLGFSFYTGDTTHDLITQGGRTTLLEGDVRYRWNWFEMNSTVVNIDIADATQLNNYATAQGTASGVIPDNIFGWNIQGGVHLFQLLGTKTGHDLVPFVLYEKFNLHDSVPAGFSKDNSLDTRVVTVGFSYLPIPEVAVKLDYQNFDFGNNTSKNQLNMGLAYMF